MTLNEFCERLGIDRKGALHVVRPWQEHDQDLVPGVDRLLLLWHTLRTLGYQSEDCHEICRFVASQVFQHHPGNPQEPLMVQVVDNRWVGTNKDADVLDLANLSTGHTQPEGQAMIGIGLCLDELVKRYMPETDA